MMGAGDRSQHPPVKRCSPCLRTTCATEKRREGVYPMQAVSSFRTIEGCLPLSFHFHALGSSQSIRCSGACRCRLTFDV